MGRFVGRGVGTIVGGDVLGLEGNGVGIIVGRFVLGFEGNGVGCLVDCMGEGVGACIGDFVAN